MLSWPKRMNINIYFDSLAANEQCKIAWSYITLSCSLTRNSAWAGFIDTAETTTIELQMINYAVTYNQIK